MLLKRLMSWRKESQDLKESSDVEALAVRIREIETRIATLRRSVESNDRPHKNITVTAAPNEEKPPSAADDLKAKLLAKRK